MRQILSGEEETRKVREWVGGRPRPTLQWRPCRERVVRRPGVPLMILAPPGIVRRTQKGESSHFQLATACKLLSILCWFFRSGMDGPDKRRRSNQYLKN